MNKSRTIKILCIFIMTITTASYANANTLDNAFSTAVALNYCHMSLSKILLYNDRIVLDEEYNEIINNVNLANIKDEEIINLLKDLMDTITKFKLQEGDKERFLKEYERRVEMAFYDSLSNISISGGGNPYVMAAQTLVSAWSAYANYRNNIYAYRRDLDKQLWQLEKESITELNQIRKSFLETYWRLMKRYKIPESWRLTENQINSFITYLKDTEPHRKMRQLERIKDKFEAYPPFWYYYGQTAQDLTQNQKALQAYKKYGSINSGFFREDNYYSSSLMNEVILLNPDKNKLRIIDCLKNINKQSPQDWRKNLFSAMYYIRLNNYDDARTLLQKNIDNNNNIILNSLILAETYGKERNEEKYQAIIDGMLKDDSFKNQDILYLLGRVPEYKVLLKMKDQILNMYVSIQESTFKKDSIILTMPDKWVFSDINNFNVSLIFDGYEYPTNKITADKEKKLVSYYFEKVIDVNDLIKNNRNVEIAFNLQHSAQPIALIGELKVITVDKEQGKIQKWIDEYDYLKKIPYASKYGSHKTMQVIGFEKKGIGTKNNVYKIIEGSIIE